VIVTDHDASGDTGQNDDAGILTGNSEFWPVSSEPDGIRFGLANRCTGSTAWLFGVTSASVDDNEETDGSEWDHRRS
jgi:hypothetical protein